MTVKRDATKEEVDATIERYEAAWYAQTRARHEAAVAEGYKAEVCLATRCGVVYLAHHHMTRCPREDCPMKDGQGSMLDRMTKELEEQENDDAERDHL